MVVGSGSVARRWSAKALAAGPATVITKMLALLAGIGVPVANCSSTYCDAMFTSDTVTDQFVPRAVL